MAPTVGDAGAVEADGAELGETPDADGSADGPADEDELLHAAASIATQASAAPRVTSRTVATRRARVINGFPFAPLRPGEPRHRI